MPQEKDTKKSVEIKTIIDMITDEIQKVFSRENIDFLSF